MSALLDRSELAGADQLITDERLSFSAAAASSTRYIIGATSDLTVKRGMIIIFLPAVVGLGSPTGPPGWTSARG
jgi:hypothetical protein